MTAAAGPASGLYAQPGVRVPGGRPRLSRSLARLVAGAERIAGRPVGVSFALLTDARMRELHAAYSGDDSPTDVLAFPMRDQPFLEGEVVISVDTARREAARLGHAPYHEVMLYAVHGVLHLLGHDDHAPRARAAMRRAERRVLRALGLPAVFGGRGGRNHR